ncbi:nucleoside-triphosphatase [Methanolobus sp.]
MDVTGKPDVGKSTVVAGAVEKLDLKACGIRTAEIRVAGNCKAFHLIFT